MSNSSVKKLSYNVPLWHKPNLSIEEASIYSNIGTGKLYEMTENKIIIPIWKKSNLTVEEAAAYCGIGSRKLREMSDSEFCPFVLWNGSKRLIKRRKLDEYLDNAYSI